MTKWCRLIVINWSLYLSKKKRFVACCFPEDDAHTPDACLFNWQEIQRRMYWKMLCRIWWLCASMSEGLLTKQWLAIEQRNLQNKWTLIRNRTGNILWLYALKLLSGRSSLLVWEVSVVIAVCMGFLLCNNKILQFIAELIYIYQDLNLYS